MTNRKIPAFFFTAVSGCSMLGAQAPSIPNDPAAAPPQAFSPSNYDLPTVLRRQRVAETVAAGVSSYGVIHQANSYAITASSPAWVVHLHS